MSINVDILEGWMDEIEAMEKWMAAFFADPHGLSSPASVEVSGDVYARQETLWTRTGPTVLTLASTVRFRNLPPGAVVGAVGPFDDPFGGLLVCSALVAPEPISYPAGGTYTVPAGEYEIRID